MTKKKLYHLLASVSLLGAAVAAPLAFPQAVYANSGTFTVGGSAINVRREPSTSGEVVAQYSPGQVIEYDSIVEGEGYRWISYVGGSGNRNYVAIGTTDGSQSFGSLNGAPAPKSNDSSASTDFKSEKGTFTVGNSSINVRREPSTSGEIVEEYQPGQKVNYDQIGTANGYRWVSYVGGSGNRNYVAIGTSDGSQSFGSLKSDGGSSSNNQETGDISNFVGTWRNGKGHQVTIHSDGKVSFPEGYSGLLEQHSLGGYHIWSLDENGQKRTSGASLQIPTTYLAAGEASKWVKEGTDSSRERLIITQNPPVAQEEIYYRVEETSIEEPIKEDSKEDFSFLAGKWINQDGEEVSITKEGIVTQYGYDYWETKQADGTLAKDTKHLEGQAVEGDDLITGRYWGHLRFNNYYIYSPKGTHLKDHYRRDEDLGIDEDNDRLILVRPETGPHSTPIEYFLYTRVKEGKEEEDTDKISDTDKKEETETSSSSKEDKDNTVSSSSSSSSTKTETSQSNNSSQTETSQTDTSSSTTNTTQSTTPVKQEVKGNPIQRVYKTLTNRQDLPSTGESVSVLGGIGLLLIGLATFLHRRRK